MQFFQTETKYLKDVVDEIRFYEKYRPYEVPVNKASGFNMILIDDEMIRNGRPYYQIYPEVFGAVSDTTLELDIDDWKVPFDIFEIRMPKTEKPLIPLQPNSNLGVISIQVFRNFYKRYFFYTEEGLCFTYKYLSHANSGTLLRLNEFQNHTVIKVNACDYKDPTNLYEYQHLHTTLKYQPERRISDMVNSTMARIITRENYYCDDPTLEPMSDWGWVTVIKLALGVSLLATGSQKVLEYDVLSKHLDVYREMRSKGNFKGCREIEEKARGKGKYGWNIGKPTARHLPLSEGDPYENNCSQGGHHNFSSFRCGHWHKYRIGKGRTKVAMKWLTPTIVRPDLPSKNIA